MFPPSLFSRYFSPFPSLCTACSSVLTVCDFSPFFSRCCFPSLLWNVMAMLSVLITSFWLAASLPTLQTVPHVAYSVSINLCLLWVFHSSPLSFLLQSFFFLHLLTFLFSLWFLFFSYLHTFLFSLWFFKFFLPYSSPFFLFFFFPFFSPPYFSYFVPWKVCTFFFCWTRFVCCNLSRS